MKRSSVISLLLLTTMGCSTIPTLSPVQITKNDSATRIVRDISIYTQDDLDWLYRTVYGEVRNQSDHEVRAVCQVIYNRLQSGEWGTTFKEVVLAPRQFSVWNYDDPQRPLLMDAIAYQMPGMDRIKRLCNEVINERLMGIDDSSGFNYFYHPQSMAPRCVKYKTKKIKLRNSKGKIYYRFKKRCVKHKRLPPRWSHRYDKKERIGAGVFLSKE